MIKSQVAVFDARVRLPLELRPSAAREKPSEYTRRYDAVLGNEHRRHRSLQDLLGDMEEAGVARALVHAEYEYGDHVDELNEATAKLVASHQDKLVGFGTVSLSDVSVMRAVRQVERSASLGLVGLNLQPAFFGLSIDERILYPVYAKAAELDLVVALHTGVNYSTVRPMAPEHPMLLDQVACDFPELVLIACHAGWPWIPEMVAVLRRHPHVYVDFGGLAPKYVGERGTGWEMMRRLMDNKLAGQVLFATDWPVFPMTRAISEWSAMGLRADTVQQLFWENAHKLISSRAGRPA